MKVLVTGGTGFAGSFLCELLSAGGHEVWALSRPQDSSSNLAHLPKVGVFGVDICDTAAVHDAVRQLSPDRVYHLAAFSVPSESFRSPAAVYQVNLGGTVNLCEALVEAAPNARLLFVSSGQVYGRAKPSQLPLKEDHPLAPANPYAGSKAAAEVAVLQFHRSHGLHAVIARAFNHTGPRQSPSYVCARLAQQVAQGQSAGVAVVKVGNLDDARDFSDVRDVVAAYELLLERGAPGDVYNVASGRLTSVRSLAECFSSLSSVPTKMQVDPALVRGADSPALSGDPFKARELGWKPRFTLKQTLSDVYADWLERSRAAAGRS